MANKRSPETNRAIREMARRNAEAAERDTLRYKNGQTKSLSPKQIRARARRQVQKTGKVAPDTVKALYGKPMEEWDAEELARGRTKSKDGRFSGAAPKWITREMHEKAMERFVMLVKEEARVITFDAVEMLSNLVKNDETDDKGRPIVPWSVKADVAKFLFEHLVGKARQPISADINVKLQGILADVMVDATGEVSSTHRAIEDIVDAEIVDEEDE